MLVSDTMLEQRKVDLVRMRIEGLNKTAIAAKIGVSRQTIYTWLKDPDVIQYIEEVKKDLVQAAENKLINNLGDYLDEMDRVAKHSEDARTKNSALQYLIDRAMGKVAQRIENVEKEKDLVTDDMLDIAAKEADAEEE